jgi:hypothetical protein
MEKDLPNLRNEIENMKSKLSQLNEETKKSKKYFS